MSEAPHDDNQNRRPHTPPMAGPFLEFDLIKELEQLHQEPEWNSGQNAKTLVKFDDFRVVLIALKAQATQPGHQTKGRLSIQMLTGHVLVRAEGRTFNLRAGSLLALDQCRRHDVEALQDSALLLTIAWPGDKPDPHVG